MSGFESPIQLAILFAALGLLLVVDYRFVRPLRVRERRPPPSIVFRPGQERHDVAGGQEWAVICPNCRTKNRFGFRYCHSCLARLPRRVVRSEDDDES